MATVEIGATGRRVAANLLELRDRQRHMSLRELSMRLREQGRPILPSGLIRAENGARRIDVDDLMALAVVLDVSPNRLLLTPEGGSSPVELTPSLTVPAREAWEWALGQTYLGKEPGSLSLPRLSRAMRENRPHEGSTTAADYEVTRQRHRHAFDRAEQAVRELVDAGVSDPDVRVLMEAQLTLARFKRYADQAVAKYGPDAPMGGGDGQD